MKNIVIITLMLFLLGSCINLKEPYPQINFYKLTHEGSSVSHLQPIDATIMIRDFTASSEIETSHLLALWDNEHIQKYFYHRWITDAPTMVTNYINNIFSRNKFFSKGVVSSFSMALPDYIVEGDILDMMAYSTEKKETNQNYVYVAIKITLIKRTTLLDDNMVLLSEVYPFKIIRKNNSVKTIPDAFSRAWAQVADQIIVDIHSKIRQDMEGSI
jgi:ABC-type uncharacterized transport system auxiliary subunit